MRLAAAFLAVLMLAGCLGSVPSTSTTGTGSCPRWIPGLDKFVSHQVFDTNFTSSPTDSETFPVAPSALDDQGRPLDRVDLDFYGTNGIRVTDARLEMRFYRSDDGTQLRAYDLGKGVPGRSNEGADAYTYGPGVHNNFTLQVHLVPMGQPARATPIRVEWLFVPDLDGNPATPSRVQFDTVAKFEYRAC